MESETIELIYDDMKICAVCGEVFGRAKDLLPALPMQLDSR
jgi:hypothetical protein